MALPADAAEPVRDHDIVAEDYFSIGAITGVAISPYHDFVAYTEMRWEPPAKKRNIDVWVVESYGGEVTRLTFDPAADTSPQWSADSKWIYFTSSRKRGDDEKPPYNGKKQVWRIRPNGLDLQAVTRLEGGVNAYELSHDSKTLYYTVSKEVVEKDAWKDLREQFDDLQYGHGVVEFSQIWKLDLQSWRKEKVVDDKRVINEFVVSPDERYIAMQTTPTGDLITNEGWSTIDVYDAETKSVCSLPDKQWRADAPSPYGWVLGLAWSLDSRSLAFRCDFDGYPGEIWVAHFDNKGHLLTQKIDRVDEVYAGGHMAWGPGQYDLCYGGDDHGRSRIYRVTNIRNGKQGETVVVTPGDVSVETFSIDRCNNAIAAVMSGLTHPPDVFTISSERGSEPVRLTKVNPQVDTWKLPQIKIAKWVSKDGTPVEGILELPPDYVEGTPLPTVIELHGGPTSASKLRFRFWIYGRVLFAARGWALLSPNYRGSTGYGDKFLTDLIGHKNDRDVADIMAGADWMVQQGYSDPDKMAVMGWSNGGYLTNCMIAHTTRFKAASSGAGVFDTVTQWLAEDTPGHVINFNGGFPWNRSDAMKKGSALYTIDKCTTPTLIHVGEKDPRCPPAHSKGLFRALHHYLKVPVELVVYPGSGHSLTEYEHRKAKMAWDRKWFDHFVLGATTEEATPQPGVD